MEPFEVQNIYGTPQIPRKKPCIRPRRMTLIDLRNVRVDEEDEPYRKSSTATIRSEGTGTQYYSSSKHGGVLQMYDSSDNSSLDSHSTTSAMRIRRVSSSFDGSTRFPKLQECAHFHYDQVELRNIKVFISDEEQENYLHNGDDFMERTFLVKVIATGEKTWSLRRTFRNFRSLDRQLHKCIYDRKFSRLPNLNQDEDVRKSYKDVEEVLCKYLDRFSYIAGSMINCGSVLNWFELDNRGNRLLAVDDSGINTPAIAAAHAVKRYTAQAADEISLEVGDIVSVIDMPTQDETIWWRGKRGFEVGFFPSECVEVIGDKVPASVENRIPLPNASRKPLVRKHGKFLSFLRMFFSTRPARNQLKQSGIVKERVFGCDLGEHLLNSGHDVPLVLKSCSEVIEKHGIVDGIYRLSGITSNIQKLRLAFDEDKVPDLTADVYLQDIHSISSLLKMYFRELPNPLLTYQLYDKFADAVRDEDNKLWKIHDVVQQLPPPHYRTTEYLMRHLAKVAAFGPDTGMHSKNLAIVWAPNLLRSKELESGGGAAALQGVGIQAVVTECLILYADLIFSDKLPAYSSPELHSSHKKPRPKSLAISTPTKLITLEEARERALSASLHPPSQKYIDVGGGPDSLPSRYHTVIDLPGYKKKANIRDTAGISKVKKSPSGWRSIFSRSARQNSIKQKGRKNSVGEPLPLGEDRKAITEEDVHNWKRRRLRGAKSAESLLAMSLSGYDSSRISRQFEDSMYRLHSDVDSKPPVKHKRSMSSESPRSLIHTNHAVFYPSFIMAGEREMPIDVDTSVVDDTGTPDGEKHVPSAENRAERKQSFVRGDNKRRVITHRRTPSAPSTPRQDENRSDNTRSKSPSHDKKTASHSTLDCSESKGMADRSKGNLAMSAGRLDMNILDSDKFVLHVTDANLFKSNDGKSLSYSPEEGRDKKRTCKTPPSPRDVLSRQTPPSPRGKTKEEKQKEKSPLKEDVGSNKVVTIDLPESPGAKRKNWMGSGSNTPAGTPDEPPPSSHFYYSRHHDYAEILSDEDKEGKLRKTDLVTHADVSRNYSDVDYSQILKNKEEAQNSGNTDLSSPMEITLSNQSGMETTFLPNISDSNKGINSVIPAKPVVSPSRSPNLSPGIPRPPREIIARLADKPYSRSVEQSPSENPDTLSKMSKCLSVPADIQKSLENMTYNGSQSDMLSSVTISELSASADSFNVSFNDDLALTCRRRRSASVDSITEVESPLTRTLREINAQIDKAFKHEVSRAQMLQEGDHGTGNRSRSGSFDNIRSDSLDSNDNSGDMNFVFQRLDNIIPPLPSNDDAKPNQTFVERPAEEIQVVETPRLIRAPLRPSNTQSSTYLNDQQISSSRTSSQPLAPSSQHMASASQHMASSSQHMASSSQHMASSSQHMASSSQHMASSSQHLTSSSQHMASSSLQQMTSSSQHVASSLHHMASSQHVASSSQHVASSSQHGASSSKQPTSSQNKVYKGFTPVESHTTVTSTSHNDEKLLHSDTSSPLTPSEENVPFSSVDDVVVKSRHPDSRMIRSDSRHGRVEFDLSDEDLDFLSRQGILQDMKMKMKERSTVSPRSPMETVQWSPEATRSQGFQGITSPSSPPTKIATDVSSNYGSTEEISKFKGQSVHKSKPPARREFAKLLLESEGEGGSGSSKSSPRSPRQQPRWEDLAGLNQDFGALAGLKSSKSGETSSSGTKCTKVGEITSVRPKLEAEGRKKSVEKEISPNEEASFEKKLQDLSDFNDIWRQQLAPTGDVCRLGTESSKAHKDRDRQRPPLKKSSTIGAMELSSDVRRERTPECGTEDQTVTLEKPMIKKCLTESDLPQIRHCSIMTQDSQSTTSSSGTSEALSEVHNISDRLILEKQSIRRGVSGMGESSNRGNSSAMDATGARTKPSNQVHEEEKITFPKPRKIQKMDSFEFVGNSGLERMDTSDSIDNQYNEGVVMATPSQRSHSALSSKSNSIDGMMASNKINSTETLLTSNHDGQMQSEVYMYSETSTSATGQGSNELNSQPFVPVMNDIDINESCFGIPTHQNLSNEFREKMQERLKSQQGSLEAPNMGGVETLQMAGSFMYKEQSEHAVHVGYSGADTISQGPGHLHESQSSQRMEVETTMQMSSDSVTVPEPSPITLPLEEITSLSQGPILTAAPGMIEALDNTEEAAQNAFNDDLELSMSVKSTVNLPQVGGTNQQFDSRVNDDDDGDDCCSAVRNALLSQSSLHSVSEPMGMFKPCDNAISWQQNLLPLPELAPPEREFMEVNRPCVIKCSKSTKKTDSFVKSDSANSALKGPKSSHSKSKIPVKGDHYRQSSEKEKISDKGDKTRKTSYKSSGSRVSSKKENKSLERGESILVMERKTSLRKKQKEKTRASDSVEGNECDINDDVFVDPSDIKCETTASKVNVGNNQHKSVSDKCGSVLPSFLNEPPNRSSLDESILQVASTRHDDFLCDEFKEPGEDIRFTRAHRSTKLKSLRELFEKTSEQEKDSKSKVKKKSASSSQEKLVCLPKSQLNESTTVGYEEKESPRLIAARSAFTSHRSYSHMERFSSMDSEIKDSVNSTSTRSSPLTGRGVMAIPYDDWQMPRSRRSISTDVGYELGPRPKDNIRRDRSWDRQSSFTNASKPPKHRSGSRTRTASESSISESENYRISSTRSSPKSPRQDGSPKSPRQDSSPKSGRESSVSAKNSPKTPRCDEGLLRGGTESPLFHRAGEDIPFHSHRTRQRSDGSPKIMRKVSFGKCDTQHSQESSPKSPRSWGSPSNRRSLSVESSLVVDSTNSDNKVIDKMSVSCTGSLKNESGETGGRGLERRGSIKELRDFFEQKLEEVSRDDTAVMSTSVESSLMRSSRVRSVSPTVSGSRPRQSLESVNVRHSLELPSGNSVSQIESMRPQPLRLGPKPFYGARK